MKRGTEIHPPVEIEEIITLTQALIRFKSTASHPAEIKRCLDFIKDYLDQNKILYRGLPHDDSSSILVTPEEYSAPILLLSHVDVVDGPAPLFEPQIKENRLYGRGSVDDKYAVALSLVLLRSWQERLARQGLGPKDLPFGILITSDEESGGYHGAKKAFETVQTDFCIALDGGSVDQIVVKEKGILRLKLMATGKAAHGARPWLGQNAIETLMEDYRKIKPFFPESGPEHWHRTVNIGIIRAGKAINQVPDSAEAFLDVRYTETDDLPVLLAAIENAIESTLVIEKKEPLFTCAPSPYLDLLLKLSPTIQTGQEHGASDARFLMQHGISGIVWGANGDLSQHAPDEHVNIDSVAILYHRLNEFLSVLADKK